MAGALRASASALQASSLRALPSTTTRCTAAVSRSSPSPALQSSFVGSSALGSGRKAAASSSKQSRRAFMGTTASAATFEGKTFYDFEVEDIKGKPVPLSQYKGKVCLVVNVASQCGLTDSNYKGLSEIYDKYKSQGFEVLAFPSNQFGAQEPGSNEQIENFACSRYKATFPMFSKVDVNGPNTVPVYQFLKSQKGGGILGNDIKWNFGKFLVDKEGKVVERYAPTTGPQSIENDIKKLL